MAGNVKRGSGSRKHGRNLKKPAKQRYTIARRWITNKAKKIIKYMKKHPNWKPILTDEVAYEMKKLKRK